ncbi:MAG: hypothetical protein KDB32_03795, partial [Planctomycetes bacterium]|nr:hypothetical protein [Planctomycetota bacterium]
MAADHLKPFERFRGKRGLVMGLGVFGGGVESAKFLAKYCDSVLVTDLRSEEVLADSIAALEGLPIEYRLGEHRRQDFEHAEVVIHSPAVRPDHFLLKAARDHGAEVTMEMSLFIEACPAKTVGITGSNGKTTTALLAYEMLSEVMQRAQPELEGKWAEKGSDPVFETKTGSDPLGKVWLGGNCGEPLINKLDGMTAEDVVVLELSSFQLQDWHRIKKSCDISVITNITPNHLDWHKDLDEYIWAKSAIYRYSPLEGAIFNADGTGLNGLVAARLAAGSSCWVVTTRAVSEYVWRGDGNEFALVATKDGQPCLCRPCRYGSEPSAEIPLQRSEFALPGEFNWQNLLSAIGVVHASLSHDSERTLATLEGVRRFRGVEHRLEYCGEVNGARCFNDSIATTPESTLAALSAFDSGVHLLLGGSEKGLSYDALAEGIAEHPGIKGVYLQGANAGT